MCSRVAVSREDSKMLYHDTKAKEAPDPKP